MVITESKIEETARQLKLEYDRAYRKAHPEKQRQYNKNRWLKKAKVFLAAQGE